MKRFLIILFVIIFYTIINVSAGAGIDSTFKLSYSDCNSIINNNFITNSNINYKDNNCYLLENKDYKILISDLENNAYNIPFEKDVIEKLSNLELINGSAYINISGGITGGNNDVLGITNNIYSISFITKINIVKSFNDYPHLDNFCSYNNSNLDCGKFNSIAKKLDKTLNNFFIKISGSNNTNIIKKIITKIELIRNNAKVKKFSNEAFILEYLEYNLSDYINKSEINSEDDFIKDILGN